MMRSTEAQIFSSPPRLALPKPKHDSARRARQRLARSPYFGLQRVSCRLDGDCLVLRGRVTSFYLKQLAQETVRKADGAREIINELEVQ